MERDRSGLLVLDRTECLRALESGWWASVALSHRAMPLVLPVSYAVHHGAIVFRAQADTTLARAAAGTVVSLCANDRSDPLLPGWSVVVIGRAEVVDDATELERLDSLPIAEWGDPGTERVTLRIFPAFLSGRRFDPVFARRSFRAGK